MATASPFTKAVVSSMRKLYPEELADKSFDNTGLLLEAPFQSHLPRKNNTVLLTIDLTQAVADEAIQGSYSVVVAYHPIIFRALKSITLANTQQNSLLRLAANGISVYSPHTAVDIVPGGMADWLCDIVTGKIDAREQESYTASIGSTTAAVGGLSSQREANQESSAFKSRPSAFQRTYSTPTYISPPDQPTFHPNVISHTRRVITSSPATALASANAAHNPSSLNSSTSPYSADSTGAGRLIDFDNAQPLSILITRIGSALGNPKAMQIAIPQRSRIEDINIKTVGLCPGSGASVMQSARPAPDLVFTGEMSHHEALAVIERGGVVIALGHSNSERGYLSSVMQEKLRHELTTEWDNVRKLLLKENDSKASGSGAWKQFLDDANVDVMVSKFDRDPFGTMVLDG